jgi:copper chaperone
MLATSIGLDCLPSYMRRETLTVHGMSCNGCERSVVNALQSLDGVQKAEADHESASVEVVAEDDVDDDALTAASENAGYEVVA